MHTLRSSILTPIAGITLLLAVTSFADDTDTSATASSVDIHPDDGEIGALELMSLPFRTIEEILGLQNGTTVLHQKQVEDISLSVPRLSVRGGDPIETGYWLNGVPVNDPYSGYFMGRVSPLALGRVVFEPTEFGALNGFAGASSVRLYTRPGKERLHGTIEAITDNSIGSDFDQNWYTATLGGSIPGPGNGQFFGCLERRYFGDRNPSSKTDDFLPGDSKRLPGNWLDGWAYNAALIEQFGHNVSLTATLDGSVTEWSKYIHSYYFDSAHLPYYKDEFLTYGLQLEHQISPTVNYHLRASFSRFERFRGDGTHREDLSAYRKPYVNYEADAYNLFYCWDDMDGVTDSVDEGSTWDDYLRHKSTRLNLEAEISKAVGSNLRFTFGGEWHGYEIRAYQNLIPTNPPGYYPRIVNHFGYDIEGNEADDGGTDWGNEVGKPKEYGVYLAGRMAFGDWRLDPMLRLDVFDRNALAIMDPEWPLGRDAALDPSDLKAMSTYTRLSPRISFQYRPSDYRLTLDGGFGLFYSSVPYSFVYTGWDFVEARMGTESYYPYANAAIEPLKVRALQLGIGYSVTPSLYLKLTGFQNETENNISIVHVSPAEPFSYDQYEGAGETRTLGLETRVRLSIQHHVMIDLRHTMQSTEYSGPLYRSTYNIAWKNPLATSWPWTTSDLAQPHAFGASVRYHTGDGDGPILGNVHPLERLTLVLTAETATGLPYTPMMPYNDVSLGNLQQTPTGPENSETRPNRAIVNLMLQREFTVGGVAVTPFVWVTNLLDAETIYYVYPGTGQADNTGYLGTDEGIARVENDLGPYDNSELNFEEKYQLAQHDPTNYGPPRQVYFGLRVSF